MLDIISQRRVNKLRNVERDLAREIIRPHITVVVANSPHVIGAYRFRPGVTIEGLVERIRPDVRNITKRQVQHILETTWGKPFEATKKRAQEPAEEDAGTTSQLRARVRTLEQSLRNLKHEVADLRAFAEYMGWEGRAPEKEG